MEKPIDPGTIFGRLKVVKRTNKKKHACYIYKCLYTNCNKYILVRSDHLRNGEVASCGCLHDELLREKVKKAYSNNFKDGTSIPKLKRTNPQANNTSGVPGVSWYKRTCKWQVRIAFQGGNYNLGYYDDLEVAKQVRQEYKEKLHIDYINNLK